MTGQRTSPRVLHPAASARDASDQARMGAIWDSSCPKSRPCNRASGTGERMGSGIGTGLRGDGGGGCGDMMGR